MFNLHITIYLYDLEHLSEIEICLQKLPQTLFFSRRKWKTY